MILSFYISQRMQLRFLKTNQPRNYIEKCHENPIKMKLKEKKSPIDFRCGIVY